MQNQNRTGLLIALSIAGLFLSCGNSARTERLENEVNELRQQQMIKQDIGEENKASVKKFFKALEDENLDELVGLFADDAKHINPYHSGIFPEGADGKDEIRAYWTPVFPNFDGMAFPIETIYAMEDPNRIFVKFTGNIKLKNDAGVYSNDYYSTFRFNDDGKISEYVEIFNPITAAKGFGLLDQIK